MKSILKIFRRNLIAGLLVLLPVFTAIYVGSMLYSWVDTPMQQRITIWLIGNDLEVPELSIELQQHMDNGKYVTINKMLFGTKGGTLIPVRVMKSNGQKNWKLFPGFGIISTLVLLFVAGLLARTLFGRIFIRVSEWFVSKIPGISTVYMATKQLGESLFASGESRFHDAVLVEYPRKGLYSIGFVTGHAIQAVSDCAGEETLFVFIPTTPNPTSGFLLGVRKKELIYLNMNVEDTIKMIISGGIIVPESQKEHIRVEHSNGAEKDSGKTEAEQGPDPVPELTVTDE